MVWPTCGRGPLALAQFASQLKSVPRTGWLDRGVPPIQVESVADHSLGVALLAWGCALERRAEGVAIDPERVLMLAILHDLAEAETGDLPPYDPATIPDELEPAARRAFLETRHRRDPDRDAAKRAGGRRGRSEASGHPTRRDPSSTGGSLGRFQQGTSREARFVKQVDRLETFLQSQRYLRSDPTFPMASFHQEVFESIDDPLLAAIRDAALENDAPDLSGPQD